MKKSSTKTASTRANLPAAVVVEVQATTEHRAWATRFTSAVKTAARHGNVMLTLVLEARDAGIPEDFVRQTIKEAYIAAGSSPESARKRASDAVTVFNSTKVAADLPKNLQEAVSAIRKEKAGTQRTPRQPKGPDGEKAPVLVDLTSLQLIELGLQGLQQESNDIGLLSIVAEMLDLAGEIAARMAEPAKAKRAA